MRPTAMVLYDGSDPYGSWTHEDLKLLEALFIMEDEVSPFSKHPVWLTDNPDVMWEIRTTKDRAEAALKKWQDNHKDEKPGEHPYAVPFTYQKDENGKIIDGTPDFTNLPTREDYFEGLSDG